MHAAPMARAKDQGPGAATNSPWECVQEQEKEREKGKGKEQGAAKADDVPQLLAEHWQGSKWAWAQLTAEARPRGALG